MKMENAEKKKVVEWENRNHKKADSPNSILEIMRRRIEAVKSYNGDDHNYVKREVNAIIREGRDAVKIIEKDYRHLLFKNYDDPFPTNWMRNNPELMDSLLSGKHRLLDVLNGCCKKWVVPFDRKNWEYIFENTGKEKYLPKGSKTEGWQRIYFLCGKKVLQEMAVKLGIKENTIQVYLNNLVHRKWFERHPKRILFMGDLVSVYTVGYVQWIKIGDDPEEKPKYHFLIKSGDARELMRFSVSEFRKKR
jgi:hypothetical protein